MILTCPQCATRYQIDDSKFPAEGRKVRCTKCGHLWFQAAPAPEPKPAGVTAAGASAAAQAQTAQPGAAPAAEKAPGERLAAAAGWIGLLAVLGLIAWGGIRYRDAIAEVWPQTARLYAALGMPAKARGLTFETVSYRRDTQAGRQVLVVNGTLANASARELAAPPIQVVLTDAKRRVVDRWTFSPAARRLNPGERLNFTTTRANPPSSARHLDIRFAGARG